MDGVMKKTVTSVLTRRFALSLVIILLAATPLFYFIVTNYYAEDLLRVAKMAGLSKDNLDLEVDTMMGLLIQIGLILVIIGIAVFIVMRTLPAKLWKPFHTMLNQLRNFRVEKDEVPTFPQSDIEEFQLLNATLTKILTASTRSYQVQKEFTENASHELQTPLAVISNKVELLFQDKDLTERQATLLQDIYNEVKHVSGLSRNLLLLAKLENNQFRLHDRVRLSDLFHHVLPLLKTLAGNVKIDLQMYADPELLCQKNLLESMVDNLVVNAVRYNKPNGQIAITVEQHSLTVSNTSDEPALDASHVFDRFYRKEKTQKGNGLGLAIVKAVCDYHHWTIVYCYSSGHHNFRVDF